MTWLTVSIVMESHRTPLIQGPEHRCDACTGDTHSGSDQMVSLSLYPVAMHAVAFPWEADLMPAVLTAGLLLSSDVTQ